jgi:hypothetical protein
VDINGLRQSSSRSGSRRCVLAVAVAAPVVLLPGQAAEAKKKKKNRGNAPGSGNSSRQLIRLLIENVTSAPIELEGWSKPDRCKKFEMQTLTPPNTATLKPNNENGVAAWINQNLLISSVVEFDEFPRISMSHGGTFGKECARDGVRVVDNRELGVGQKFEITVGSFKIEVVRENDIGLDVVFRARLQNA